VPEDGKSGQYQRGDGSNGFHPSSGEVVEWLLDKSVEVYKYLIKQAQYPFSPRYYNDMRLRPEAPEIDLALVGAKISEVGEDLPGCFTYNDEGRDILEGGVKRITWNVQNNGTDTRIITSTVKICDQTEDPTCTSPIEESLTRELIPPEKIETFVYDFAFKSGRDYSVEMTTGESNVHQNDLKRFVFTTTESSQICPAGFLVGYNQKKMDLLRQFRDEMLGTTPEGRQLIKLYYQWSPVILKAMEADEDLKQDIKGMIDELLPLLEKILSNFPC
jgi:hypothetical protein